MKPILITLDWVPPFAHGYVKDLRVRWALEEAGIAYDVKLIKNSEKETTTYRQIQPYGQVPAYEEGEIHMYESGAIVLYIGEKSEKLLSKNPAERARALTWMFSATNTLEPHVKYFNDEETNAVAAKVLKKRLAELTKWLEGKEYLENKFSAGDIMMCTVLRDLGDDEIIMKNRILLDYRTRCEYRPAFKKALNDQLESLAKHNPEKKNG